jgi:hypothetical protein
MTSFLRKRAKCILCWQTLDTLEETICTQCETQSIKAKQARGAAEPLR